MNGKTFLWIEDRKDKASYMFWKTFIKKICRYKEECYKTIQEIIKYDNHLDNHNIEQLSAKLLFDLTRNTGFEVSKGMIGKCWIDSCCN